MVYFIESLGLILIVWLLASPVTIQVSFPSFNTRRQLINHARSRVDNPADSDSTSPQNKAASDNDESIVIQPDVKDESESNGEGEEEEDESWAERFKSEKEKNKLIRGLTNALFSRIQLFPDQAPMERDPSDTTKRK
ncbi:uncharacterized protein LOC142341431 isoform X2 [Convolutriloba macropyga]|uniref:uncharacterized protein LOC142341431 isoform X2 n=1 Tax=Convolutriloba macropyga TaxID=536237 RepID=UPI003F5230CF